MIESISEPLDRDRVGELGQPISRAAPWTVYRGVADHGIARRPWGYSWTESIDKARWFAARSGWFGLASPAIVSCEITLEHVLFYSGERNEREFFVALPPDHPYRIVEHVQPADEP